jgi:hypothetical protein
MLEKIGMQQPEREATRSRHTLTVPWWIIDAAASSALLLPLLERWIPRCDLDEMTEDDGTHECDGPATRATRRIREIRSFITVMIMVNKSFVFDGKWS